MKKCITCLSVILLLITGCMKEASVEPTAEKKTRKEIVIYRFGADWCGPCREMDRSFWSRQEIINIKNGYAKYVYLDIDTAQGAAASKRYRVDGIPCVILVDETGKEISRKTGYSPRQYSEYKRWLESF